MACFQSVSENSKKYFKTEETRRDQGNYYLKILSFLKDLVVFWVPLVNEKAKATLEVRMKNHFSDKAPHSFTPDFQILNAILILSHLRTRVCIWFSY